MVINMFNRLVWVLFRNEKVCGAPGILIVLQSVHLIVTSSISNVIPMSSASKLQRPMQFDVHSIGSLLAGFLLICIPHGAQMRLTYLRVVCFRFLSLISLEIDRLILYIFGSSSCLEFSNERSMVRLFSVKFHSLFYVFIRTWKTIK